MKSDDIVRTFNGESNDRVPFDVEARKHGNRAGLETPVVHALNNDSSTRGIRLVRGVLPKNSWGVIA